MTGYATRIRSLFDEIDRTPWGPAERALVAQAVALAQESGDERLEYEARMRQTASANMGGDTDLMLTSFAWCLGQHDADPERFPAELEPAGDLMWHYKWMAGALRGSPEFSSEQITAVLDDMQAHYERAGHGMSGVLMARFEDAWSAGRIDEAAELRRRLEATPRDEYSHCDACTRSQFAGFFAETGDEAEAIRLVEELVEGGFTCGEEPEHALARSLLPYLHARRPDEARAAHLRSYRLAKDNADNLSIIAKNIVFCAVTGNEARALALVERHLPWLTHDGLNAGAHLEALAAFAVALDAVAAAGHPDAAVRGSDAEALVPLIGAHEGAWPAAELAARMWAAAENIAQAFDARNATDAQTAWLAGQRAVGAERYEVPVSSHDFAARSAAPAPRTPAERVERALALHQLGSIASLEAIREALGDADVEQRVSLTHGLLAVLVALGRLDEAQAALPARLAALRAAGRVAQAQLEEELGLLLYGAEAEDAPQILRRALAERHDAPAEVRADLLATLAFLRLKDQTATEPDDRRRTAEMFAEAAGLFAEAGEAGPSHSQRWMQADMTAAAGDLPEAVALLEALLAEDELSEARRARALLLRARTRGGLAEYAAGAADADEATRIHLLAGADDRLVSDVFFLAGALHEDAGAMVEAVSRYRVATERREATGAPATDLRFRLGRALLGAGLSEEAIEVLDQVLQEETAAEEPAGSRAITVGLLTRAFEQAGQFGNALGGWEFVAQLHEEADEPAARAYALKEHGRLLGRFGEIDDAIDSLTQAVEIVRGDDEQVGLLADGLHTLAQAHQQRGDLEKVFALLDEAVELGRANDAAWFVADVLDTRARALAAAERTDEAVATALQAADGFVQAGDATSAGRSEFVAARILMGAARPSDAVALYRAALEHAGDDEALRQTAALELGDVLESLGRPAEAAEVRATLPA
ncbi:tetratricopeptide (TPR) repeat protein [Microbacterium sp. SORGH_AS428]|uniref:hypothetical protein n=1 Tax=Microbacterium sp. SORGH_AS_0428 TaxID=3041788 RepID=UPI002865EB2C|nr:hypothetical protein [Microbacterium sp. SORGH_AS_0428]MDR6200610.1 tetratricopeptide (TPR) repeat protein [Microbacterium sp. SORGH_AS_0428]